MKLNPRNQAAKFTVQRTREGSCRQREPCVCPVTSDSLRPHGPTRLLCPQNFPSRNTAAGCHFLFQGIFPTQGSNPSFTTELPGKSEGTPEICKNSPIFESTEHTCQETTEVHLKGLQQTVSGIHTSCETTCFPRPSCENS